MVCESAPEFHLRFSILTEGWQQKLFLKSPARKQCHCFYIKTQKCHLLPHQSFFFHPLVRFHQITGINVGRPPNDKRICLHQVREAFQNIIAPSVASNQVVCVADGVAGCNYVYDNNGPIVSECSRLDALTAGCSISHCCPPAQLERNTDVMTHNWSFKVHPSDTYWFWRKSRVGGECAC